MNELETRIARRCELLYGKGARPHMLFCGNCHHIDGWLLEPENFRRVTQSSIGQFVLFKQAYQNGDEDEGVSPIDGHLVWRNPKRTKLSVDIIHGIGGKIFMYVAPNVLRDNGMDSSAIIAELWGQYKEFGFDGVYCDGLEAGPNIEATCDVWGTLRGRGVLLFGHQTVQPHISMLHDIRGQGDRLAGNVPYWTRVSQYFDYAWWGETNVLPENPNDMPAFLRRAAHVETFDGLTYYKVKGNASLHHRAGIWARTLDALHAWHTNKAGFDEFYANLHYYEDMRHAYRMNPDDFVRRVAGNW